MLVHALRELRPPTSRSGSGTSSPSPATSAPSGDVDWVFALFDRYGSIDFARATLGEMVGAASDEFEVAYRDAPPSADRDFVRDLIPYLGGREV